MSTASFELRLVEAPDEPFLYQLFASTQGQQFYLLPLEPAQREALVRMQFEAQRTSYRQEFPASEHFIILVEGQPAGLLWIDESGKEVRVIDIVLAPGYQGHGIGKEVLERVIAKADRDQKAVRLFVDRMNVRAFGLYRRFGFEVCGEQPFYLEMRREPAAAERNSA